MQSDFRRKETIQNISIVGRPLLKAPFCFLLRRPQQRTPHDLADFIRSPGKMPQPVIPKNRVVGIFSRVASQASWKHSPVIEAIEKMVELVLVGLGADPIVLVWLGIKNRHNHEDRAEKIEIAEQHLPGIE